MINNFRKTISRAVNNLQGWKTSRKILVIESDDWGSIRMPNIETFEHFLAHGYPIDKRPFEKYDTLATSADLNELFDSLHSVTNANGQKPILTANTVVANPDFIKIKEGGFQQYFYEPFTSTLDRYYPDENVFETWRSGIREKVFYPQFHAREHYNVNRWMSLLRSGDADAMIAFEYNMVGIPSKANPELGNQLQIALAVDDAQDIEDQKQILSEGLSLFKNIFGYKSKSFIAPVYTWSSELNSSLATNGIEYLQGGKIQKNAQPNNNFSSIKHILGETNEYNQTYLVRNVFFEPSTNQSKDWVTDCFKDIEMSFLLNRPAIISMHRLNFIGSLNSQNRTHSNKLLRSLLQKIIVKYPEVEFMTSAELGNLMSRK